MKENTSRKGAVVLRSRPVPHFAVIALFFALLGGSAYAVGERLQSPAVAQPRCAQRRRPRGIAVVPGIASQGIANFPLSFTSAGNLFGAASSTCTGKAPSRRAASTTGRSRCASSASRGEALSSARATMRLRWSRPARTAFSRLVVPSSGRDDRVDLAFTIVVV